MSTRIKDINRNACQDFCDLAGRDHKYGKSWMYALLLDIVIPIASLIIGITLFFASVIFIIFTAGLGLFVVIPVLGIIYIIHIIVTLVLILLLAREIGLFVGIGFFAEIIVSILTALPEVGIIFTPLNFVPWYVVSVFVHVLCYNKK